ncbi:hypothetical protein BH11BAC7_BH11BAC7_15460 [soil metagenome]
MNVNTRKLVVDISMALQNIEDFTSQINSFREYQKDTKRRVQLNVNW